MKHNPVKDKSAQLKKLKELMNRNDVECVINGCDAGREGENIFRLVYEYAKCKKPLKRLWISSMEDAAIKAGFDSLKGGAEYDSLYDAASCRERADWLVGLNTTRLLSVLYGTVLNAGRVQSPTLAMLVKREADISAFVKEPFYTPNLDLEGFAASGEKAKDMAIAETIAAACNGQSASVTQVERKQKTVAPPKLYDLTSLQRDANRLPSMDTAIRFWFLRVMNDISTADVKPSCFSSTAFIIFILDNVKHNHVPCIFKKPCYIHDIMPLYIVVKLILS